MFDKTSESFKEQLIKELIVFENTGTETADDSLSYYHAGVVSYVTPDGPGEVDLVITLDQQTATGGCSLRVFKSGKVAIVFSREKFINLTETILIAIVAHELGHLISGHAAIGVVSFPNLHIDEVSRTYEEGDAESHMYWSVKAIVDGGYLPIEFEADLIASKFVGFTNVCFMHLSECFKHKNPTVVLEKHNRLKALNDILKDTQTPSDGYSFEIVMNNTNA